MTGNIQNHSIQKGSFVSYFWHGLLDNPIVQVAHAAIQSFGYITSWVLPMANVSQVRKDPLAVQHQANTWDCIGYTANEGGGKIYQFRLKEEYRILPHMTLEEVDKVKAIRRKKIEDLFPAVEDFGDNIPLLINPQMKLLGYDFQDKDGCVFLSLPDQEALEVQFEKVRKTHPELRPLKVQSSEGIATDHEFIESFAKGSDALLSTGKEFVHDHVVHILPTLRLLFSNPQEYYLEKERASKTVKEVNEVLFFAQQDIEQNVDIEATLHELNQVRAAIAMTIDLHWSPTSVGTLQQLNREFFIGKDESFSNYRESFLKHMNYPLFLKAWEAKFKTDRLSISALFDCWGKIYWNTVYQ